MARRRGPIWLGSRSQVDPICFLLYRRDVLYNFLYRKPPGLAAALSSCFGVAGRQWGRYFFRWLLHHFLTTCPSIQSCFRREFWWSRHCIFRPAELACSALVVLSGRDAIVPSHAVRGEHLDFVELRFITSWLGERSTRCGYAAAHTR